MLNEMKKQLRFTAKKASRFLISRRVFRRTLNQWYLTQSFEQYSRIHTYLALILRNSPTTLNFQPGDWKLRFLKRDFIWPLYVESFWLDWALALSVLGHEISIKKTYLALLESNEPPTLFVDIGANYGTHSILFMIHGVKTISFEPNPECHDVFRRACAANNLTPQIEGVAVGNTDGQLDLHFPDGELWLGTVDDHTSKDLAKNYRLNKISVNIKRLDDFVRQFKGNRLLIKIDTEGHESEVLRGCQAVIEQCKPIIIFESWFDERRTQLMDLFPHYYRFYQLPYPSNNIEAMTHEEILSCRDTNFIAIPNTKTIHDVSAIDIVT